MRTPEERKLLASRYASNSQLLEAFGYDPDPDVGYVRRADGYTVPLDKLHLSVAAFVKWADERGALTEPNSNKAYATDASTVVGGLDEAIDYLPGLFWPDIPVKNAQFRLGPPESTFSHPSPAVESTFSHPSPAVESTFSHPSPAVAPTMREWNAPLNEQRLSAVSEWRVPSSPVPEWDKPLMPLTYVEWSSDKEAQIMHDMPSALYEKHSTTWQELQRKALAALHSQLEFHATFVNELTITVEGTSVAFPPRAPVAYLPNETLHFNGDRQGPGFDHFLDHLRAAFRRHVIGAQLAKEVWLARAFGE